MVPVLEAQSRSVFGVLAGDTQATPNLCGVEIATCRSLMAHHARNTWRARGFLLLYTLLPRVVMILISTAISRHPTRADPLKDLQR